MNYYPHHIGDYAKDASHLTMIEDGAYRRMMDAYYSTEKPLPLDRAVLYRRVKAQSVVERRAVDTVLTEFFKEEMDGWHSKRCDEEIARAGAKSEKARQSAAQRWHSDGNANAQQPHCEGIAPNNQEPRTNSHKPSVNPSAANAAVAKPPVSPCPHMAIIKLYHEHVPTAQQVNPALWNGTRFAHLQARWREDKTRQSLDWWKRFFIYISQSDFLTGRTEPRPGKTPFLLTLAWIVNVNNFQKIHEGTYHRGRE